MTDSESLLPFRVAVPDSVLEDLKSRLEKTRFPAEMTDAQWGDGADLTFMKRIVTYWREEFDWRAAEASLNEFEQWQTAIDGEQIHFIHERSDVADAMPILLLHGWPDTVFGFSKIITQLTGGLPDGSGSFHVVCPSLPGFAWSGPTHSSGWDVRRIARAFAELMQRLGYKRFLVHGGDWGSLIATEMAIADPKAVLGLHLNFVLIRPPVQPELGVSDEERLTMTRRSAETAEEFAYDALQSTKPQSLGIALNDSPIGLAAWIIEKYRSWGDCGGDVESRFTLDELLTTVMSFWVTGTITSSMRLYRESAKMLPPVASDGLFVDVPMAYAAFPREIVCVPRAWVESRYNVRRWTVMKSGGHFPAMEEPEELIADIRGFVSDLT